jgi:hypothetical protein
LNQRAPRRNSPELWRLAGAACLGAALVMSISQSASQESQIFVKAAASMRRTHLVSV